MEIRLRHSVFMFLCDEKSGEKLDKIRQQTEDENLPQKVFMSRRMKMVQKSRNHVPAQIKRFVGVLS